MKRQTRIITLLVIDSLFFFVEIIIGKSPLPLVLTCRLHGALIGPRS